MQRRETAERCERCFIYSLFIEKGIAYYFHSLLQRSHDITLCYNNATEDGQSGEMSPEDGQSGEMSRFMLQLLVESHHDIERFSLVAGQNTLRQ